MGTSEGGRDLSDATDSATEYSHKFRCRARRRSRDARWSHCDGDDVRVDPAKEMTRC